MEWVCIGKQVGGVTSEFCKPIIFDKIKQSHTYIKNYKDNIRKLDKTYDDLKFQEKTISDIIKRGKQNLQKSTAVADRWLDKVHQLLEEAKKLQLLIDEKSRKGKDQCCFRRFDCNLYQRYVMSKTAEDKSKEIEAIIGEIPPDSKITETVSKQDLEVIPTDFLKSLDSRVALMKEIMNMLQDDQVHAVAIYGMGGIGKTVLVKEICNKRAKDLMFDEIVMVEISEAPNIERIQDQIAEQVGLSFGGAHSIQKRAIDLHHRLKMVKVKEDQQSNKKLIILDNIWEKLDLSEVGIPQENTKEYCCKILVTSRNKNVCEAMGVPETNIKRVPLLNDDEASKLLRARVGHKRKDQEAAVEKRFLDKCGGLPLAIVALADVLRNQEFSMWEHFANELEKSTSNQASIHGVHPQTYSILETSYKLMDNEDKRRFFLLACLFYPGSSIPIQEMMRYGIGLGLFQHANNLIEAMKQAYTWVDELKSSSLLLDVEDIYYVKIHDVVRSSTISFAEKGGDMFMVDAFPRWMYEESYEKYYAISLPYFDDHSLLNGLKMGKLQILILSRLILPGNKPPEFDNELFEGMTNLKVLVLKRMHFEQHGLPRSIRKLKNSLRTLCLERCVLEDLEVIGELVKLVVLSLRGSSLKELPRKAMKKLCKLRLLDLRDCYYRGSSGAKTGADVLAELHHLEGVGHMVSYGGPMCVWCGDEVA